jgi:hypothetical protein
MALSYKNLSCNHFLKQIRNINFANAELIYGFQNNIDLELTLFVDVLQIALQADIFANEIISHNSTLNLKRILGPFSRDWVKLLHETYVYDRCRCIFYGINGGKIVSLSDSVYCFPGNLLLVKLLHNVKFNYTIQDTVPYSLNLTIFYRTDPLDYLNPVFEMYPELANGMSSSTNMPHYYNSKYEGILRGLFNYINSSSANSRTTTVVTTDNTTNNGSKSKNKPKSGLYVMNELSDISANSWISRDSNPSLNSYLNNDGLKFFFILPTENSNVNSLRSNESLFVSRAIGLRNDDKVDHLDNHLNMMVRRNPTNDKFTKEEVYSITGLRSEIEPNDVTNIFEYLSFIYDEYRPNDERFEMLNNLFRYKENKRRN